MKKINLIIGIIVFAVASVFAQSNNEEIELYQSIFGMEKKAVVSQFIKLEGEKATSFWKLYDEYEVARKVHGQKRIELLNKYVTEYENLDDAKTNEINKEMIALGKAYNKLILKYYKSINKACDAKTGGQFYQLEVYFQSTIRLAVMEQIPFLGEFDK